VNTRKIGLVRSKPRFSAEVLYRARDEKIRRRILDDTWWNFYFRLFPGAIKGPQIVEFLEHLLRHLPGKLLVIWDGLPGHRSRLVSRLQLSTRPSHSASKNSNTRTAIFPLAR